MGSGRCAHHGDPYAFPVRFNAALRAVSEALAGAGFGALLRRLRLGRGLSQEMLAERADLSVETIGALERGVRQAPYRSTVDLLAAGLQLDGEARKALADAAVRGRGPRNPTRATPSLPQYATSFVGRERERRELVESFGTARLITICGPGGVGKTRLAIEAAGARSGITGDARFVDLASLRDPALVPGRIATGAALGAFPPEGGIAAIVESLRSRELLLVFDNCEHLIDACAHAIEAILRGCAGIRIVATSREPLLVDGESIYRLEPFPDAGPAIALFVERARAVAAGGDFAAEPAVARAIAERLGGIPLAIELAAALARTQSADDIARMLASEAFLAGAARRTSVAHQRTMEATLAWSYALLSESERAVLRALAYPVAGTAPGAVDALCGTLGRPTIRRLIDTSLVREDPVTGRLAMHEMTRQYVASVTSHAEAFRIARNYAAWLGAGMRDAFETGWQSSSYAVYEPLGAELDNLRQALAEALADLDRERALDLASAPDYWTALGRTPEGFRWLRRIDAELDIDGEDPRDATLLFGIAMCAAQSGLGEAAREPGLRATAAARRHGASRIEARCAVVRGNALLATGDARGAESGLAAAAALFTATNDTTGVARALSFRALALIELGLPDEAARALDQVTRIYAEMPGPVGATEALVVEMLLGDIARLRGDTATALDRSREAAALLGDGHRTWIHLRAMHQFIDALIATGDFDGAVSCALPELERLQERGFGTEVALIFERVALVLARRGAPQTAARAAGLADQTLGTAGRRRMHFDRDVRSALDAELTRALGALSYAALQMVGRSEDAASLVAAVCADLRSFAPSHR